MNRVLMILKFQVVCTNGLFAERQKLGFTEKTTEVTNEHEKIKKIIRNYFLLKLKKLLKIVIETKQKNFKFSSF